MNLWDMRTSSWNHQLLQLTSGEIYLDPTGKFLQGQGSAAELERKLGQVYLDAGESVGLISYFSTRYDLNPTCRIYPGTGDNPATFLAFSLAESESIVSLGTSDTVMVSTDHFVPDPEFHAFVHPARSSGDCKYFNMLVYKSGSLAREWVRDEFCGKDWERFNKHVEENRLSEAVGFYWLRPEVIPAGTQAIHRYVSGVPVTSFEKAGTNAAAILESQFLNYRYRSCLISGTTPKSIYAVGGASSNVVICQTLSDVFGCPILKAANYNFCSVGAAYKTAWGYLRTSGQEFDKFISVKKGQDDVRIISTPQGQYDSKIKAWKKLEEKAVKS